MNDPHRAASAALAAARNPVWLAALAVLLVNDRWLKGAHPGVVSGKLSDVAWLVVVVPLSGLLLAPLAARLPGPNGWRAASCALPGAALVSLNVHEASAAVVRASVAWLWPTTQVTVDPTDLLALPALLVGWWLLGASVPTREAHRSRTPGWALIAVAVLATTATSSCDPPEARLQITVRAEGLAAVVNGLRYASTDAGRTWDALEIPLPASPAPSPAADPAAHLGEVVDAGPCLSDGRCFAATDTTLLLDGEVVWAVDEGDVAALRREWHELTSGCGEKPGLGVGVPQVLEGDRVIVNRSFDGALIGSLEDGFERVGVGHRKPVEVPD